MKMVFGIESFTEPRVAPVWNRIETDGACRGGAVHYTEAIRGGTCGSIIRGASRQERPLRCQSLLLRREVLHEVIDDCPDLLLASRGPAFDHGGHFVFPAGAAHPHGREGGGPMALC